MSFIKFLNEHFKIPVEKIPKNISSVCCDSQKATSHCFFVAIKGKKTDGHNHLKQAVQNGAKVLLVEDLAKVPSSFKGLVLQTKNSRQELPRLLNEFYNFPSQQLFTIGITGTNGKTSVSYILEHIFKTCGWPTGVIGTINQHFEKKTWESGLTTPAQVEIFQRLQDFIDLGAKACAMEVSSIGLEQGRLEGVTFNAAVFTNLTWDHLDYHLSLENYFKAKQKLFVNQEDKNFFSIINIDDKYGKQLIKNLKTKTYSYGNGAADFSFQIKSQNLSQTVFDLQTPFGQKLVSLPLTGVYNVYNAVAALACSTVIGFALDDGIKALESFAGVAGRLEKMTSSKHPFQVFVDYAHTPLALASVLKTLSDFKENKLIVMFGCGGDRDKEKRPAMMAEALKFADKIFLTSDNPRTEDPNIIMQQCLQGLSQASLAKVCSEWDRKKSIAQAIDFASPGDIVLIAGKGHEPYQIIGNKKIPFSDLEITKSFL